MALEAQSVICRVAGAALCLVVLAACAARSDGRVPDTSGSASHFVLIVRQDGPRWLGPVWWDSLGLDIGSLDQARVMLLRDDVLVPLLWVDSPDGPGALFFGQIDSSSHGAAGIYELVLESSISTSSLNWVPLTPVAECQSETEATLRLEEDLIYRPTAPLDSPWLWVMLRPPEQFELTVHLPGISVSEPVTLTVYAWGQSAMPENPDHGLRVLWNGDAAGDHLWDGNSLESWTTVLPSAIGEDNVLILEAPGEAETPVEVTWLDALELSWRREITVDGDGWTTWSAEADGNACVSASGERDGLVGYLVDEQGEVLQSEVSTEANGDAPVRIGQQAGGVGWIGLPWLAPAPDHVRPVERLAQTALDSATYVVVAPPAFHLELADLVALHQGEGHVVELVTPESIYDTYGRGLPDAAALQAMVRRLIEDGDLQYVLLVGDTSPDMVSQWDPGALAIPTAWTRTTHMGHTASDFGLASGGTGEALVAVGRIPARSADELRHVVAKTVAWQSSSRLLLVSDDEAEFAAMIERLGAVLEVGEVLDAGAEDARCEMLRWLGQGPGTFVYSGHGSLQLLGDEKLLTVGDGQNWQQPSVIVTWSCLCASFAHPTHESLGEALVLAPKGAVAFIGPTGETTSSEQMDMAIAVQTALTQGDTIGGALLKGWRAAVTEDSRQGFVLLGDPALRPMPGSAEVADG